jgi:hypothetical protein
MHRVLRCLTTLLVVLCCVRLARAQTSDAELRAAAAKIAAMQAEAREQTARGNGPEAIRLREEAQKLWNTTVANIAQDVDRKRRAEDEMARIAKSERQQQAAKEIEVGLDAWKSAQAGGKWVAECSAGPETCLANISKARTAIEKGFSAAEKQLDANIHGSAAEQAQGIREKKQEERSQLEKTRDGFDALGDRIDYANEATSHSNTPQPVPIGGEFRDDSDERGKIYWDAARGKQVAAPEKTAETLPNADDYDALLGAEASQGKAARETNDHSGAARRDDLSKFADDFAKTASDEERRVKDSEASVKREAKSADVIDVRSAPRSDEAGNAAKPPASGKKPSESKKDETEQGSAAEKPADHCKGGVFHCPNGLPWKECGHAEKYDCPPPEYAAEAQKVKTQQQSKTGTSKKP